MKDPKKTKAARPSADSLPESPHSSVREFPCDGTTWLILDAKMFAGIFGDVSDEHLAMLKKLGDEKRFEFPWRLVRMLCGIRPAIPEPDMVDHVHTREEIAKQFDFIEAAQNVDGFISPLEIQWRREADKMQAVAQVNDALDRNKQKVKVILTDDERELLESYGFSVDMFSKETDRSESEMRAEIRFFYERVHDMRQLLDEPSVKSLARMALMNELQLRRLDQALVTKSPLNAALEVDKTYKVLQDAKGEIEKQFLDQWAQITRLCPSISASSSRRIVQGIFSEMIEGMLKFKANEDDEVLDGLFTGYEIQCLMRHSEQMRMQYRPGFVASFNEGKMFLSDPHYRRRITDGQCRILDECFRLAEEKFGHLVPKPNLESKGEDGEYPDLFKPPVEEDVDYKDFVDSEKRPSEPIEIE